jgi:hypothetical protein
MSELPQTYGELTFIEQFKTTIKRFKNGVLTPKTEHKVRLRCSCGRQVIARRSDWKAHRSDRCKECALSRAHRVGFGTVRNN